MSDSETSGNESGDGITLNDLQAFASAGTPSTVIGGTDDSDDDDFVPGTPKKTLAVKSSSISLPAASPSRKKSPAKPKAVVALSQTPSRSGSPAKRGGKKPKKKKQLDGSIEMYRNAFDTAAPWKPMGRAYRVKAAPKVAASSSEFTEYCGEDDATFEGALERLAVLERVGKDDSSVWGFFAKSSPVRAEVSSTQLTTKRIAAMAAAIETGKTKWGRDVAVFWDSHADLVLKVTGAPIPAVLLAEIQKTAKAAPSKKRKAPPEPSTAPDDDDAGRAAKRTAPDGTDKMVPAPTAADITFAQFAGFAARHNISSIQFR